jgi:hypothetical protein
VVVIPGNNWIEKRKKFPPESASDISKKSDLKHINDSSNLFYFGNECCVK